MIQHKFINYLALLIIAGSVFSTVALAAAGEVTDIERHVPSDLSNGKSAEITLEITGATPFVAGIVEIIPEGFEFPEDDADVSDESYFRVDRDAGKIAFYVSDENEIAYNVIPSTNDGSGFEGYWADMLFQTQELNEGKERWVPVTDPNSISTGMGSSSSTTGMDDALVSNAPGFGAFLTVVSIIASLFIFRNNFWGDKQ